jgi:hypothetical protein
MHHLNDTSNNIVLQVTSIQDPDSKIPEEEKISHFLRFKPPSTMMKQYFSQLSLLLPTITPLVFTDV